MGKIIHQCRHLGANDIAKGTTVEITTQDIKAFVCTLAIHSPSQWHGNVEYGEHSQSLLGGEKIGNHCGGNGCIACLPHPYQQSGGKQHPVVLQARHKSSLSGEGLAMNLLALFPHLSLAFHYIQREASY